MKRFLVVFVALTFSLNLIHAEDDTEGSFNLVLGNCSYALARDLVYHEHVDKVFVPLVQRNATSVWYGDQTVYCIKALNENEESEGGVAFIKEGGISHHFVTIEMHSKTGNALHYDVQVYGH
ncbi:hypothetical protein NQ315_006914 [Exocentrus adspersus]|uniref:Uncharacterized protein n=1 Tax=Exocentrus adspersus TaxID=1586481 RepID=A0AAV8WEL1_9CUCU|nr:hypothetical protein NQ315_006914 [Exocentrus adspersus]